MTTKTNHMKQWKGRWLIAVSAIHTAVAIALFGKIFGSIINEGVFNTVGTDPMTGLAVWFAFFGAMLFVFGLAVNEFEKVVSGPLPRSIGWGLIGIIAIGVTLMPASGFWLAIPPAISILRAKPNAIFIQSET
ncbi:MAG: hypothetical protein RL654_2275 [Pseudomonadota bacterium]